MVWNQHRHGWEMPGGHIETDESSYQAASREYMEEAGYKIYIVSDIIIENKDCIVYTAILGNKSSNCCEMKSNLFSDLPEELSFCHEEYDHIITWARSTMFLYIMGRSSTKQVFKYYLLDRNPVLLPRQQFGGLDYGKNAYEKEGKVLFKTSLGFEEP